MLQIISGRFFGEGQIEVMESDAILYSNLSWVGPIKTGVAELRPVEGPGRAVLSYVVRYHNRYEKRPGDRMLLANADEAIDQFRLLCSFWFRAFFHPDRNHVELLCRAGPRNAQDNTIPRSFVPRFFDPGVLAAYTEATGFVQFVAKVLAMPRQKYKLVTACLTTFFDALEAIGTNFDLAYSMMVYLLEAMCQSERWLHSNLGRLRVGGQGTTGGPVLQDRPRGRQGHPGRLAGIRPSEAQQAVRKLRRRKRDGRVLHHTVQRADAGVAQISARAGPEEPIHVSVRIRPPTQEGAGTTQPSCTRSRLRYV